MRLTLRTLLSYLDNVLDEPAQAALREQIESSEHASEWVHRTRDVMRRLRLGPPEAGSAAGLEDANEVAAYLDRTLPDDRVPEFERQCLESDAMLAEVASCHAILAMVLEAPASVDPDTRARMLRLREDLAGALRMRVEQAHPGVDPSALDAAVELAESAPAMAPPIPAVEEEPPEESTPDYLTAREPTSWLRWAPAVAAVLLFAATAILLLGPRDEQQLSERESDQVTEPATSQLEEPAPSEDGGTDAPPSDPSPAETNEPPAEGKLSIDAARESLGPESTAVTGEEPPAASPSQDDDVVSQPQTPTATGEETAPLDENADPPPASESIEPREGGSMDSTEPLAPASEKTDPPPEAVEFAPVVYLGPPAAIVLAEREAGSWERLEPGEPIGQAVRVASLSTSNPRFDLGNGLALSLIGSTKVVVQPPGEEEPSGSIDLQYGRVAIQGAPVGEELAAVRVVIDGVGYAASLGAGALLAIEADRPYAAGASLLEAPQPRIAVAHVLTGPIEWRAPGETLRYERPRTWVIESPLRFGVPEGFDDASWATNPGFGSGPQAFAASQLSQLVTPGEPAWPQLAEIAATDPLREVSLLAMQSCLALGHPELLVESFRDGGRASDWPTALDSLRSYASRGVDRARLVEQAFSGRYGEEAAKDLMDLVAGYRPEEIGETAAEASEGVAAEVLLPLLGSDELAIRALAWLVMKESFEPMERPFSPIDTAKKRARAIRSLRSRLADAELTPRR